MSWSISFIGNPEKVVIALEQESAKLSGQSKVEYDAALPHFIGLVKENFSANPPVIRIQGSGHGYVAGEQSTRQCTVNLELLYGVLV